MKIEGLSVTYTDSDGGQKTLFAMTDWTLWMKLMGASDEQSAAARENTNKSAAYLTALHDYQTWPDKLTPPVKPQMRVVSDMGESKLVDFVPALPDPVIPTPGTPAPSQGSGKATTNLPPVPLSDADKAIMAALVSMSGVLAKIQAKVGA